MTVAASRTVRAFCHAHPNGDAKPCGMELGDVPLGYRFVRTSGWKPEWHYKRIRLKCGRSTCRMWNVFEAE